MQYVIIGGRGGKPFVAVRERLLHPGVQKSARIGFIGPAPDVLQAPFKGKDPAVVVGGPPGVLVAAYFLF